MRPALAQSPHVHPDCVLHRPVGQERWNLSLEGPAPCSGGAGRGLVLTGAVEVHREAMLHVLLDELQRALEYLARSCLLHGVRVPRVAEQGQQVIWGAWPAGS